MLNPLKLISKFIKSSNQKELDRINKIVEVVNKQENYTSGLKDEMFPKKTQELIQKLTDYDLDNIEFSTFKEIDILGKVQSIK